MASLVSWRPMNPLKFVALILLAFNTPMALPPEYPVPIASSSNLPVRPSATRGRFLAGRQFTAGYFRPNCATCHAVEENPEERRRLSGPPLYNSWYRENFKEGRFTSPQEAVNDCMVRYQGLNRPAEATHITHWLKSISHPEKSRPFAYAKTDPELARPVLWEASPDSLSGRILWELSCAACHDGIKSGDLRGIAQSRESIYQIVRGLKKLPSRPKAPAPSWFNPGTHPPFNPVFLRDEELSDIIEYILREEAPWKPRIQSSSESPEAVVPAKQP